MKRQIGWLTAAVCLLGLLVGCEAETQRNAEQTPPPLKSNVASAKKQPSPPSAWPGKAEALVFLWESDGKPNEVGGKTCRVKPRGNAKLGPRGDMDLAGGAFVAEEADAALLAACQQSNQLSIEATLTPANITQVGPARIISFSESAYARNFTLGQEAGVLVMRLRTPNTDINGVNPEISFGEVQAGKTIHTLVSYSPGQLSCYVNGELVLSSIEVQGDLSNWEPMHLVFGDEWDGERDWAGRLEGIAIYSRALSAEEAKGQYARYAMRQKN